MNSFPAQTEKIEPADRSHIDFVRRCSDGSFRGVRVRHSICILVETETGDIKPKTFHEVGVAHVLPSRSALSPMLEVEREILRLDCCSSFRRHGADGLSLIHRSVVIKLWSRTPAGGMDTLPIIGPVT